MIEVFSFASPLEYLQQLLVFEKTERLDFSLDRFSEALSLSRSALSMILTGKRNITLSLIHKIARELKFSESEHAYWEALVHCFQAENESDKIWYQRKLIQLRSQRKITSIRTPTSHLVSAWYVPAVLVYMIDLAETSGIDVVPEVAQKLSLPESLVRAVVEKLESDGFLQFRGRGDIHVSFDRIAASVSSKRFLKDVLSEASRRIEDNFENRDSFFTSHTFSIAQHSIPLLIQEYKDLLQKFLNYKSAASSAENAEVVVTSFQLFPVLAKG